MDRLRRAAWLLIVVADAGILLWGAMAALAPEHLLGPGGAPILPAGYEGFSRGSWPELGPAARGFMEVLFRVYGAFNVAFGLLAIAIAATAFRRGDRWAWWALLAGNTIAFIASGMSCGGVIALTRQGVGYQVRVNWLTGGVEIVPINAP